MTRAKRHPLTLVLELLVLGFALLSLVPFYFLVVNSFKPIQDILLDPTGLPTSFTTANYVNAFEILQFPRVFLNSLIITFLANTSLVVVSALAAYRLVRHPSWFNNIVFFAFVAAMIIPFQSIMIPMVKVASGLGLVNNYLGVTVVYLGFGVPFSVFLFHGFIKTVPLEIEEAARIDGCTPWGVFWRIVFPLLRPIVATVLILNVLWVWNDFLLPLLIVPGEEIRTIPLAINSFFGQYSKKWDLAMAGLVLAIIPMVLLFLSAQRQIIAGIVAGSVKG